MGSQKLVFRRTIKTADSSRKGWLARLRAELGGTVQVAQGWDLTSPTGEIWDAERQ